MKKTLPRFVHPAPFLNLFALPAAFLLVASPSSGSVPSAAQSTVSACLPACPQGDIAYSVVIRDLIGNPIPGSNVVLDFGACANLHLCPGGPTPDYAILTPTSIRVITNAAGTASLHLEAAGTCASAVKIYADGVLMTDGVAHSLASVANTDQDGDMFVLANDATVLAAKTATDPTADLNCDGTHDAADAAVLEAHMSHVCRGLIDDVRQRTWGELKIRYR